MSRAPVVEALTVYLFNNRILKPEMFGRSDDDAARLHPDGRRAILRGYEAWLDRRVRSPQQGRPVLWRRLLLEQAMALAAHYRDEAPYAPYAMDY